jgi:hypothetical protein
MYLKENDLITSLTSIDVPTWVRIALLWLFLGIIFSLAGCGTATPVVHVDRHPPAADMVRLDPLPHQTDPTLGGIFKGYVNAAQQYRGCVDRLTELQDWVTADPINIGPINVSP